MRRTTRCRLVTHAAVLTVSSRLLRRLSLPHLQRVLEPRRRRTLCGDAARDAGTQYASIVDDVMRRGQPLVVPGCMTRGITLYALLRRAGVDVVLQFGVNPDLDGRAEGHCWLEYEGEPFLERTDPRTSFTGIARISRAGVN
jgi:transglutaminase superfamily protein